MYIGAIASSLRLLNSLSKPSPGVQPGAAPKGSQTAPDVAGAGSADPFQQLSSDVQAKLLQLQATGSDTTQASASMGKTMKPHHHSHGNGPDASGNAGPGGAPVGTTTAGATVGGTTNASMVEAIRQAMQAYSASAAKNGTATVSGT